MREPTTEEMVEGIAKGFENFLRHQHPYGELSTANIAEAIKEGASIALEKKMKGSIEFSVEMPFKL